MPSKRIRYKQPATLGLLAFAALAPALATNTAGADHRPPPKRQDGAGPLPAASFTGLARFTVEHGTGRYARTTGGGRARLTEDAAGRHRMTLVGSVAG